VAATFLKPDILRQAIALLTQAENPVDIIWIHGQNCTGCSISALQANLRIGDPASNDGTDYYGDGSGDIYLANILEILGAVPAYWGNVNSGTDLEWHPTLMAQAGCYYSDDGEEFEAYVSDSIQSAESASRTYVDAMQYMKRVLNESDHVFLVIEGSIPYPSWGDEGDVGFCEVGLKEEGTGKYKELWQFADLLYWILTGDTTYEGSHDVRGNIKGVIAFGNCAAFGGIPGGNPNPTGAKGVMHFFEDLDTGYVPSREYRIPGLTDVNSSNFRPLVNLSACPAHPDWLVLTFAAIADWYTRAVAGGYGESLTTLITKYMELDQWKRPKWVNFHANDNSTWVGPILMFGKTAHDLCPRKPAFDAGDFALTFEKAIDDTGNPKKCLLRLGCRGVTSWVNCPGTDGSGIWNKDDDPTHNNNLSYGGTWCVNVNAPCNACGDPNYPDNALMYQKGFFMECRHSEMLALGLIPGSASSAPAGKGLTCYTCHSVMMPRKYKEWTYGYHEQFGYGYWGP
jgi:Ni,Fe-hydrogenase I small subunit